MHDSGRDWFANPVKDRIVYGDHADIALSALLLSLAHQGKWSDLLEAEAQLGSPAKTDNVYHLQRQLLQAIAKE